MKLAKLDQLPKQDNLFGGTEPLPHYEYRQVIAVEDGYDFVGNNATDVSSVTNWMTHTRKVGVNNAIMHANLLISDWSTHDQDEKDLLLEVMVKALHPCVDNDQKADLQSLVEVGYNVINSDNSKKTEYWDGVEWKVLSIS